MNYIHVSKRFVPVADQTTGVVTLELEPHGTTYNVGRNKAKRRVKQEKQTLFVDTGGVT